MWSILRIRHRNRNRMHCVDSHHQKAHLYIDNTFDSALKCHTWPKLSSLLLFYRGTCIIISHPNDVPIFSFLLIYWFDYHTWIEHSIDMPAVHYSEVSSERGESNTLRAITEDSLVWGKTGRFSSGRHSQIDLGLSALHALNHLNLLPHV